MLKKKAVNFMEKIREKNSLDKFNKIYMFYFK